MTSPPLPCRVCHAPGPHAVLSVREMMFGTRERFDYLACGACGCVQIAEVPEDLAVHYPPTYYSYGLPREGRLRRLAKRQRLRHALGLPAIGGRALAAHFGTSATGGWLAPLGLGLDADVLDVGSGTGALLRELRDAGFTSLTGADPFVPAEADTGGIRVVRQPLRQVEGAFDLVMMHHTFEHVPDPAETLAAAARLLRPGGFVVVRIPVADSFAFRTYGADWAQLDAPRHLYLHTRDSLGRLAADAGLAVRSVVCDSNAFQLWGSEQYRRDIPLHAPRSQAVAGTALFSPAEIARYDAEAERLNELGDGDQAVFTLVHAG